MPSAAGFTACQMSTYGWPVTSTCGSTHRGDDPALLGAGHQVVDQHAEPAAAVRARSRATAAGQVVDRRPAARPPPPRPAGRRPRSARPARRRARPRPRSGWPGRPGRGAPATATSRRRCGPARRGRRRRRRPGQRHRPAVEQEAGRQQREHPPPAVPVLQRHRVPSRTPTTAPQKPVPASSHHEVGSAATSGTTRLRAASRRPARRCRTGRCARAATVGHAAGHPDAPVTSHRWRTRAARRLADVTGALRRCFAAWVRPGWPAWRRTTTWSRGSPATTSRTGSTGLPGAGPADAAGLGAAGAARALARRGAAWCCRCAGDPRGLPGPGPVHDRARWPPARPSSVAALGLVPACHASTAPVSAAGPRACCGGVRGGRAGARPADRGRGRA